MPKATLPRGLLDRRPRWLSARDPEAPRDPGLESKALPLPGGPEWRAFTDARLIVVGLDVAARKLLVRQILHAIDRELEGGQRRRLEEAFRLWGTVAAALILRRLTKGGQRTWHTRKGGKPGLLHLVSDFALPPFMDERSTPDCIWLAHRQALNALVDFTVDLPAARVLDVQRVALKPGQLRTTRGNRPLGPSPTQARIAAACAFYGIGFPARAEGKRVWRFYPWRLWHIDQQFEMHGDVRLASLYWLNADHFTAKSGGK